MEIALFVVLMLVAGVAIAQGTVPWSWDGLRQLGPVVLIALLGGLVAFYRKVREGAARPFNFAEFIGEMVTSGVVGVIFFWLCRGIGVNEWMTAAIVGIAGHAGSRGMFLLEKWIEKKLDEFKLTITK